MIEVCSLKNLQDKKSTVIMVDDTPIAVFFTAGKLFAWDNRCPHRGASLADGHIKEESIQCKFHLWEFGIEDGCAVHNPDVKIEEYPVKEVDGVVYLDMSAD
ncbi:MAG: Rieske (2Fe-2S) protein [Candidatus Marinimicrobia bacterium]|jgi:nitrite reductase (NADH) small subunit/3-phenylpropionate/trans-cinnamate dioxygenase ferredoxin subunit|nr:Rieske (2Fe-2S) protein [Candidatus Neomarinimicrobiota bacterium]MDP6790043.1 Rieske (2Fe-2S) protein [Candidatus Neomarinimicrobiota bacterium]MDP7072852.1 Rieske (2Fe-2S) protein [Candidatus Neomarinimicrobiota bacterium]